VALAAVLATSLVPSVSSAQVTLFFGAGPAFPMGEFGDYAKTGWQAIGGFSVPVGSKGLSVGSNLSFGSNKHSDIAGDKTNLFGGFGFLQYRVGNPERPGIYIFGEAGVLSHAYKPASSTGNDETDWKPAVGAGAGLDIPVGGAGLFIEASIVARSGTAFVPIMAGFAVPVGGRR
jgi:hypothetical protein